jgi:ribonuclease HII
MGFAARALPAKPAPSFDLEAALMDQYGLPVAGIDEAGRGPWAGPVVVAAVILNPDRIPEGLNDSKLMTPEARAVVGGDGLSLSVAAASIVAKVTRDRMMVRLSRRYRRYAWDSNKGYGTPEHAAAIKKHGVCTHHRRSFSPIERALRLLETGEDLPVPEVAEQSP